MEPRISISILVDYMLAETAGGRRAVLKAAKSALGRKYFAPYYAFARKALRDYHSGDKSALTDQIARLNALLREARKPRNVALLANNLRALSDYNDNFNDVILKRTSRRFVGVSVAGIVITCEPTLSGTLSDSKSDTPANIMVEFSEEAPIQAAANYTTQLLYTASGTTFATDPRGAQLWHPTSGSVWVLQKPLKRTARDIEAACNEIAMLWPAI